MLDSNFLRELRRSHGLEANPFAIHPRAVISLPWLRTPRVQRLLDEVLTPQTRHPGFFDLLIVDEAHHCAPPAPQRRRGYAVDSKQTRAVRRLGEHAQHRLFLSATPHNGYSESWQALLQMLDPHRFARGTRPGGRPSGDGAPAQGRPDPPGRHASVPGPAAAAGDRGDLLPPRARRTTCSTGTRPRVAGCPGRRRGGRVTS